MSSKETESRGDSSGESKQESSAAGAEATRQADVAHSQPPSEACERLSLASSSSAAAAFCYSSIRQLTHAEPVTRTRAYGSLVRPEFVAALRRVGFELDILSQQRQSAQGTRQERPELRSAQSSPQSASKRLLVEAAVGPGPSNEELADRSLETSSSSSSSSESSDCDNDGTLARMGNEPTPQKWTRSVVLPPAFKRRAASDRRALATGRSGRRSRFRTQRFSDFFGSVRQTECSPLQDISGPVIAPPEAGDLANARQRTRLHPQAKRVRGL